MATLWGLCLGLGILLLASVRRGIAPSVSPGRQGRLLARVQRIALGSACGLTLGTVAWLASGTPGFGVVVGASAGLVPALILRSRRVRLERERDVAWPDVVDDLVSSVRSGQTVTHSVMRLTEHRVGALASGARAFAVAVTVTADVGQSLTLLADEWSDATGDRIVETLRLAHDMGGPGAVSALVDLGREVHREALVSSEIRARQAWIRVATWVGLLAPWFVVAFLLTRPEGREAYASEAGTLVLVGGYVLTVIASLLMRRVSREIPKARVLSS